MLLLSLPVQSGQVFACGRLDAGLLRQTLQKLFITLPAVSAHNGAHGRVGFQGSAVNTDLLTFQQTRFHQQFQYPSEYLPMRLQIDQPPRPRVVEWSGVAS